MISPIKSLDDCETTTCLNKATELVFWPGQEMRFCPTLRAARAQRRSGDGVPAFMSAAAAKGSH